MAPSPDGTRDPASTRRTPRARIQPVPTRHLPSDTLALPSAPASCERQSTTLTLNRTDLSVASEMLIEEAFDRIANLPREARTRTSQEMSELGATLCRLFEPLVPKAPQILERFNAVIRASPAVDTLRSPGPAFEEAASDNQSPQRLCGYLSRLLYWHSAHEELRGVHEGTQSVADFLQERKLGYALTENSVVEITPLFIRVFASGRGPDDEANLMGRAPAHAPVILISAGQSPEESVVTDKHERMHFKLRNDPAFWLPSLGDALAYALIPEGYVGKMVQLSDPTKNTKPAPVGFEFRKLDELSGDFLLDLTHEEFACQGMAGLGKLICQPQQDEPIARTRFGPETASAALDQFNSSDPTIQFWLLGLVDSGRSALSTFGNLINHAALALFEASAGAGGMSASYQTSTNPKLPPKALALHAEFCSSIHRALLGVRNAERLVAKSNDEKLARRYQALFAALRPSEYYRMPELLGADSLD